MSKAVKYVRKMGTNEVYCVFENAPILERVGKDMVVVAKEERDAIVAAMPVPKPKVVAANEIKSNASEAEKAAADAAPKTLADMTRVQLLEIIAKENIRFAYAASAPKNKLVAAIEQARGVQAPVVEPKPAAPVEE